MFWTTLSGYAFKTLVLVLRHLPHKSRFAPRWGINPNVSPDSYWQKCDVM